MTNCPRFSKVRKEITMEKRYTLPVAIALVVGTVIGSGVFFKAEAVLTKTGGNLTLQAFYTNDAAKINDYGTFKVVKGKQLNYKTANDGVLVSQAVAKKNNLKVGDKVKGKVAVMADYGAFIEIAPGVEGLIHVSEMSWSQHLRSAQDFMKVGDEVEAVILTLDRDERKMSLGIKQLKQDPWETIEEKYPVGSKHTAKVRNFTNFGVFVEIEEGVDGLIHISDLSWTKKVKHPSEFTQIGADIEVQVLEIDKENRRLSLGHKQLEENPWDVFETVFTVGSVHEGTIIEMLDKGAVVALPYGVEGFATPKHLVKEDGSQAQLDEKLSFKVIEFNKDAKRIILSHSRIFEDAAKAEERAEKKAASNAKKTTKREDAPAIQNQAASTTLGDIDALAALKEQLENKKK